MNSIHWIQKKAKTSVWKKCIQFEMNVLDAYNLCLERKKMKSWFFWIKINWASNLLFLQMQTNVILVINMNINTLNWLLSYVIPCSMNIHLLTVFYVAFRWMRVLHRGENTYFILQNFISINSRKVPHKI